MSKKVIKNVWINKLETGLAASVKNEDGSYTRVRTTRGTKPWVETGCFNIIGSEIWLDTREGKNIIRVKGEYELERVYSDPKHEAIETL